MNNALMNICIQVFVRTSVFTSLGRVLLVELLGPIVRVCLTLSEIAKLFFKVTLPFCTPTSNEEEFPLLHIWPHFHFSHTSGWIVLSYFNLHCSGK